MSDLIARLRDLYLEDPTLQATAFWKFESWMAQPEARIIEEDRYTSFTLKNQMLYRWPLESHISPSDRAYEGLIFSHPQPLLKGYSETCFFKLFHRHRGINVPELPEGYSFKQVEPTEFEEVRQIINESYTTIQVTLSQVQSWTRHSVYDANLWVWIVDETTGIKAALGIAEIDTTLREGSLEWIQVAASHRGLGLGSCLVKALLHRLKEKADFTTVSGEVDNVTQPERLYRSCGFEGDRLWYVYRKLPK